MLFVLLAMISISASAVMQQNIYDDSYSGGYQAPVPVPETPSASQILNAWDVFISTLPATEQVQLPAELMEPDPVLINEILVEQQTIVQQTLQQLQNIMKLVYDTVRGIIRNLR